MERSFVEWLQYFSKTPGEIWMETIADKINKAHIEIGNPVRFKIDKGIVLKFYELN